jgi:amidase
MLEYSYRLAERGDRMEKNYTALSIAEQLTLMEKGELTSKKLTELYLERIALYDRGEKGLNSVLEINPDALFLAEARDEERISGNIRGPLHGIPILIKDNINTKDKMHTSAGSLALADNYAPYDAFVVQKLREAGAVLLGKTNLTEFANFMTENMPNGYSSRGGQVVNPYVPGETGGSSAGSGVAAAAELCSGCIGTETSGSILSPCHENSIAGIKPTVGLISRYGIIPIANSQDTAGPMTRTVEDAAIMLGALTGIDVNDAATLKSAGQFYNDYTQFLDKDGLKGKRIGLACGSFLEEVTEEMKSTLKVINEIGGELVENVEILAVEQLNSWDVLKYEFKNNMNSYLASLGDTGKIKSLSDIIQFNNSNKEAALKYGQTILIESNNTSGTLTEPEYIIRRLKDLKYSQKEGIDHVLEKHNLDALLFFGYYGCDIAAKAGYPSVIVPAGYNKEGRPFGITFTAKAFSEPMLIKLAYSYEQATKVRVSPNLI